MPVESTIYRKFWGKYQNSFSKRGFGYGWTERASVRSIPVGLRIDHVLTDKGLTPLVCEIGPDVGSDHLPVITDIAFQ
jgi:exonuclease III